MAQLRHMPRFHFNTVDGRRFPDEDGSELPGLDAARLEAVRVLGEILQDYPEQYWAHQHFAIIVTDDQEKVLFSVEVAPGSVGI